MRTLVLEKTAIKQNLTILKERAGSASIYGVITANGGGCGTMALARLLRDEGIARFAVRELDDVIALRKGGFVDEEILMMTSTTSEEELEQLVDLGAVCSISSLETGMALNGIAERRSTIVEAHIQVDTGMGFGGFLVSEPKNIMISYTSLPNVAISGIYTQIIAMPNSSHSAEQLTQFTELIATIQGAGYETGTTHAASSYTLLNCDFPHLNAVRAGSAILGRCRGAEENNLRAVGYGEATITECRWLPKGHFVGAGKPVVLKRATRVAVIPVGYQNGFGISRPRDTGLFSLMAQWWENRNRSVRIGGQRAPIIGQVGADEIIVDVTNIKCNPEDVVAFPIDPLFAQGFLREYR